MRILSTPRRRLILRQPLTVAAYCLVVMTNIELIVLYGFPILMQAAIVVTQIVAGAGRGAAI